MSLGEFSHRTRDTALKRFREETFDFLVIGGGITGAAVARDACSRGLRVALVERRDFAYGTSSRSSKLIHGGLRYLENFELGLVFEALAERSFLLRSVPHMVRPLPFYLPVYKGDAKGGALLSLGLWIYDLLALFRAPGFHQRLSRERMLEEVGGLCEEGLTGGFRYFDASMWDDVLAVETLRSAQAMGAAVANYVEAAAPLWSEGGKLMGFRVRDRELPAGKGEIDLRARRVIVCAGPWTDEVGQSLSPNWKRWLNPSKGVHLLFSLQRLPVPGALVMSHPEDGRVAFVIPRPDLGAGVVIVGTTDGLTPPDPDKAEIEPADVEYLLRLLKKYFPKAGLGHSDILSAYVGVRPLFGATSDTSGSEGQPRSGVSEALQKVSREHHIGEGPGGAVIVAGGKYTTHRTMAREIVDFTLERWRRDLRGGKVDALPKVASSRTRSAVNPKATADAVEQCRAEAARQGQQLPESLVTRYGGEALEVVETAAQHLSGGESPGEFPLLEAQLRYCMRTGMVMHLEDFYLRRIPLFAARADHGLPWADRLATAWADERGLEAADARREAEELRHVLARREAWRTKLVQN